MLIAVLIGIMISIVVGVTIIPTIRNTAEKMEKTASEKGEEVPGALSAMLDILPIIFVAVVLLGAVAWIGAGGGDEGQSRWSAWREDRKERKRDVEQVVFLADRRFSMTAHEEEGKEDKEEEVLEDAPSFSLIDRKVQEATPTDSNGEPVSWRKRGSKS